MSPGLVKVDVSVPPCFLCPISLELMRDPVTVSSGQTFDRSSIEKWLDDGHCSCPITRQALRIDEEPIPNHVLRRMIQAWCVENTSLGVERISTPRQPASSTDIGKLISSISYSNVDLLGTLRGLDRIANTRPRTRGLMLRVGVLPALASCLSQCLKCSQLAYFQKGRSSSKALEKAGEILRLLALFSEAEDAALFWKPNLEDILSVSWFIVRGEADKRQCAVLILSSFQIPEDAKRSIGATEGFMGSVIQLINETWARSVKVSTAGLFLLLQTCCGTRNRELATEAGAVDTLIGLLASEPGKTRTELVLKGLEALCGCAEGRAAMCRNARGIEEVVGTMGEVSARATKHALETLWVVLKMVPASLHVEKRAVKAGALVKVYLLAQSKRVSSRTTSLALKTLKALS